jgi:hypothetical protein
MSLRAVGRYTEPTKGRPTTVWSVIQDPPEVDPALREGT